MEQPHIVLKINTDADADEATRCTRHFAVELGFGTVPSYQIATAAAELSRNLLDHAGGGVLEICALVKRAGIMLVATDSGPGIADIALAMNDGYSTKSTLGSGLPAVLRMTDEMGIESHVGMGTKVWVHKWL